MEANPRLAEPLGWTGLESRVFGAPKGPTPHALVAGRAVAGDAKSGVGVRSPLLLQRISRRPGTPYGWIRSERPVTGRAKRISNIPGGAPVARSRRTSESVSARPNRKSVSAARTHPPPSEIMLWIMIPSSVTEAQSTLRPRHTHTYPRPCPPPYATTTRS